MPERETATRATEPAKLETPNLNSRVSEGRLITASMAEKSGPEMQRLRTAAGCVTSNFKAPGELKPGPWAFYIPTAGRWTPTSAVSLRLHAPGSWRSFSLQ